MTTSTLAKSPGWQSLMRPQPGKQRFPGLNVMSTNSDGTHQLEVLDPFWKNPEADIYPIRQLLTEVEVFLDERENPIVQACKDPVASKLMLDIISAAKLYRKVPSSRPGQHDRLMQHAKKAFEKLRLHIQENGMALLLNRQGYRILRRINQFSRPAETFGACDWLFTEQRAIHRRLAELSSDIHHRCAAPVFQATIDQLARFEDEISEGHKTILEGVVDYFREHRCEYCFSAHTRNQIMKLIAKSNMNFGAAGIDGPTGLASYLPPSRSKAASVSTAPGSSTSSSRRSPGSIASGGGLGLASGAVDASVASQVAAVIKNAVAPAVQAYADAVRSISQQTTIDMNIILDLADGAVRQELGLKPRADERAQHMTLQSMPSAPAAMDSPASQGLPAETLASTAAHQHVWPQSDPSSLPGNPHLDAYLRSKSDTLSPYSHVFDNENTFPFASTPGLAPDLDDPAIASRLAELLSSMSTQMQGGPFTQDQ